MTRPAGASSAPQFGVYVFNGGPVLAEAGVFEAVAEAAEALGYDSICVYDHLLMPVQLTEPHPYGGRDHFTAETRETYFEPLTTLAYLAGRTRRVKLVTSALIAPYRPALVTAKMLASLDVLSGGRLILGVGVGWTRGEFDALGVPFGRRGRLTDETLRVWRAAWTEERPSFRGEFYSFDPVLFGPKPLQKPHPPLWIGGHSRAAMRRAVRLGDGWHATRLALPEMAAGMDELRSIAIAAGRDFAELTIALKLNLRLGRPAEAAADLAGPPEAIVARLRAYQRLGVSHFLLDVQSDARLDEVLGSLQGFAETVRPQLGGPPA